MGEKDVEESFNRTFMELKFGRPVESVSAGIGFNRTFMELKLGRMFRLETSIRF